VFLTYRKPLRLHMNVTVYPEPIELKLEVNTVTVSMRTDDIEPMPISVHEAKPISVEYEHIPDSKEPTRSEYTYHFRGNRKRDVITICKEHMIKLEKLLKTCKLDYKK